MRFSSIITIILPGIVVAPTGVGAGDLAGASFAGSKLGAGILWAAIVGSALISAGGVSLHAMIPIFDERARAKIVFGLAATLAGFTSVRAGGFRFFF